MIDSARRLFPGRIHDIRYEDLIADFPETVGALLTFLGVDASQETIENLRRETDFKRLSGGRAPGETDPDSYFRKGIAGDWKNHFSDEDKSVFKEVAGDLLIELGYEQDMDW